MRAKYLIGLLVIIFTFLSCKRDPLPEGAIDRKTFINVLTDIHLAEGMYSERHRLKLDSLESASTYISALKKYNVTEEAMLATTLYYSRHPREYDKVFTEVLSKISVLIEENSQTQGIQDKK
ncbi:MAG: DUF4296 domain-containing protein [Prolixibacteraceae bacterium]|nr:DUF4296 domain-containing protein [Prolixibacteraceae bacterium]